MNTQHWDPLLAGLGALPQHEVTEDCTAERCAGCGRGPGVVSAPGVDRFDLGAKHCLNRLSKLIQRETGASQQEAEAIVLRLQAADVELP